MAKKKLTDTQFVLTKNTILYLNAFDVSPATKLVLVELSTHYNPKKNNKVVFPTIQYIAETLGIGLTTVKQALKELKNNEIIAKSKRKRINGNYNEYTFTAKFFEAIHFVDLKSERITIIDYVLWREAIYNKFDGICQSCGKKGGIMHAHHIKEYAKYPDKRYDIANGTLLCEECHKKLHPWM